jgi:hypothetical protein
MIASAEVARNNAAAALRPGDAPHAAEAVKRLHVRAELRLVHLDGVPIAHVALWARRQRRPRPARFWEGIVALHEELLTVASDVLPPPAPEVVVDVFPAEPALFERVAGEDEVRLRMRAVAKRGSDLEAWAGAVWTELRALEAKVDPSSPPRAPRSESP